MKYLNPETTCDLHSTTFAIFGNNELTRFACKYAASAISIISLVISILIGALSTTGGNDSNGIAYSGRESTFGKPAASLRDSIGHSFVPLLILKYPLSLHFSPPEFRHIQYFTPFSSPHPTTLIACPPLNDPDLCT